jgi:hypothetical protein
MAKIPFTTIEIPVPRSSAEIAAEIQRPGPGGRHVGNHWGLNRRPWAHQFIPGLGSLRYDEEPVERQQLERVAVALGGDPLAIAALPFDELLVIPEIAAQLAAGATTAQVQFPPGTNATGTIVPTATEYEPTGVTGSISDIYVITSLGAYRSRSGPSVPAPVIVRAVSIWSKADIDISNGESLILSITGTPITIEMAGQIANSPNAGVSLTTNHWVLNGSAGIHWQGRGISPQAQVINAVMTYEKLRRKT